MIGVLLVSGNPGSLGVFAELLSQIDGITVIRAASTEDAWQSLGNCRVDVVVADEQLVDGSALPFVKELISRYPLINCAMVSNLSTEDFHEMTEGLGVFMQLPKSPGAGEALKMVRLLASIDALLAM